MPAVSLVVDPVPGAILAFNDTGSTIAAGFFVHLDGWNADRNIPKMILADQLLARSAMAIVGTDIPDGAAGRVYTCGALILNYNTNAWSLGAPVFLGEDGEIVQAEPAGRVEYVGIVAKQAVDGSIYIFPTAVRQLKAI